MKTIANVYLLPTEEKCRNIVKITKDTISYTTTPNIPGGVYQHLYITLPQSDLELSKIKDGDWCIVTVKDDIRIKYLVQIIVTETNQIYCKGDRKFSSQYYEYEKIIATTDSELIFHDKKPIGENINGLWKTLPSIAQSFIEYFITEYNKGNIIKEVEVELEYNEDRIVNGKDIGDYSLQLNQQNEISIVIPEDITLTWEQAELMLSEFICKYCPETSIKFSPGMFLNDWIKENLK